MQETGEGALRALSSHLREPLGQPGLGPGHLPRTHSIQSPHSESGLEAASGLRMSKSRACGCLERFLRFSVYFRYESTGFY